MSATMAGAVKAWIEGLSLGLAAYRDGAPVDDDGAVAVSYPHVVVQEGIGIDRDLSGDYGDPDGNDTTTELVQVSLLQLARRLDPASPGRSVVAEDYTLADRLAAAFRGGLALQAHAPWHVYGVRVDGGSRTGPTDNLIRHTWTLRVRRATRRTPA